MFTITKNKLQLDGKTLFVYKFYRSTLLLAKDDSRCHWPQSKISSVMFLCCFGHFLQALKNVLSKCSKAYLVQLTYSPFNRGGDSKKNTGCGLFTCMYVCVILGRFIFKIEKCVLTRWRKDTRWCAVRLYW